MEQFKGRWESKTASWQGMVGWVLVQGSLPRLLMADLSAPTLFSGRWCSGRWSTRRQIGADFLSCRCSRKGYQQLRLRAVK